MSKHFVLDQKCTYTKLDCQKLDSGRTCLSSKRWLACKAIDTLLTVRGMVATMLVEVGGAGQQGSGQGSVLRGGVVATWKTLRKKGRTRKAPPQVAPMRSEMGKIIFHYVKITISLKAPRPRRGERKTAPKPCLAPESLSCLLPLTANY